MSTTQPILTTKNRRTCETAKIKALNFYTLNSHKRVRFSAGIAGVSPGSKIPKCCQSRDLTTVDFNNTVKLKTECIKIKQLKHEMPVNSYCWNVQISTQNAAERGTDGRWKMEGDNEVVARKTIPVQQFEKSSHNTRVM